MTDRALQALATISSIHSTLNAIHQLLGVDDPVHAWLKVVDVDLQWWWSAFNIGASFVVVPVDLQNILATQPGFMLCTSKLPWPALALTDRADQVSCVTRGTHCLWRSQVKIASLTVGMRPFSTPGAGLGGAAPKHSKSCPHRHHCQHCKSISSIWFHQAT